MLNSLEIFCAFVRSYAIAQKHSSKADLIYQLVLTTSTHIDQHSSPFEINSSAGKATKQTEAEPVGSPAQNRKSSLCAAIPRSHLADYPL
jgi:hypothetical protein